VPFHIAREAMGALGTRHSLRPLIYRGANGFCKTSGASRRGNAKVCLFGRHCEERSDATRHCERSEAIHLAA
jgi:hypothetical protein